MYIQPDRSRLAERQRERDRETEAEKENSTLPHNESATPLSQNHPCLLSNLSTQFHLQKLRPSTTIACTLSPVHTFSGPSAIPPATSPPPPAAAAAASRVAFEHAPHDHSRPKRSHVSPNNVQYVVGSIGAPLIVAQDEADADDDADDADDADADDDRTVIVAICLTAAVDADVPAGAAPTAAASIAAAAAADVLHSPIALS